MSPLRVNSNRTNTHLILIINGGSSNIEFAVFAASDSLRSVKAGKDE